eukprot:scaffold58854_cov72-Phaeocystis_antarctica.AAC.1
MRNGRSAKARPTNGVDAIWLYSSRKKDVTAPPSSIFDYPTAHHFASGSLVPASLATSESCAPAPSCAWRRP